MSINTKLTETPRKGFDAVNLKLSQQYEQLVDLLAQRLGPDHARLFAEPVPVAMTKTGLPGIAWFADGDGEVRPVTRLNPDEAQALRRAAARLTSDVANFADTLEGEGEASRDLARLIRDALVTPDEDHLWSLDGQPVLVAWGYRHARLDGMVAERGVAITASAASPIASAARPQRVAPPVAAASCPPPPSVGATTSSVWRGLAPAFWLLFVILSLLLGGRLLQACGVGGDGWPPWLRSVLPDHCPVASIVVDPLEASQRAAIQTTEAELHAAELALTRRALACDASCPLPQRAAVEVPRTETPRAISADVERRLERIERGRYLELTLAWEGSPDLDLQVVCPDQTRLQFNNRAACGGRLVADQNEGGGTSASRPIEHIIWDVAPSPPGTFGIEVNLYERHGDPRAGIPFQIVLSRNGQVVREEQGTVSALRVPKSVFTFPIPLAPSSGAAAAP
ncbi:hypothetical protein [Methylobacterium sp. 77]|uniref:hypothetical protein n=1 Tax=Methylobacterium sp. 77 TaxID=1101192 RepID=UPI0003A357BA|nr:hypothetical protein [Methylobacterium sp. 77]